MENHTLLTAHKHNPKIKLNFVFKISLTKLEIINSSLFLICKEIENNGNLKTSKLLQNMNQNLGKVLGIKELLFTEGVEVRVDNEYLMAEKAQIIEIKNRLKEIEDDVDSSEKVIKIRNELASFFVKI